MDQSAKAILPVGKSDLTHIGHSLKSLNENSSMISLGKIQKLYLPAIVEQFALQLTTHLETLLAPSALTLTYYINLKKLSQVLIINTRLIQLQKTKQTIIQFVLQIQNTFNQGLKVFY